MALDVEGGKHIFPVELQPLTMDLHFSIDLTISYQSSVISLLSLGIQPLPIWSSNQSCIVVRHVQG